MAVPAVGAAAGAPEPVDAVEGTLVGRSAEGYDPATTEVVAGGSGSGTRLWIGGWLIRKA